MVDIQWLIGGEAGYGIMTIGAMMSKVFTRLGMSVFDYVEYPSLIRGGHNAYYVRGVEETVYSQKRPVDILVALNRETIDKHKNELSKTAAVLFDPSVTKINPTEFYSGITLCPVPFLELTQQVGADRLMINTVAIGASLGLFYEEFGVLQGILQDAFGKKGEKVVAENVNTSKAGFDYVAQHLPKVFAMKITKKPQENILISGAEAVALGGIKGGLQFAAMYPMTPINTIMTTLISHALQYGIIVKEPEDEIAGINMAIGASFAGVRSMVATSGGGFSLMVESLGLAAQTETPLVIVEGMRPGPATGMPTWTDQGDLRFVLHAAQGDFPRVVLAPGDMMEAYTFTMHAFNLAEKYQLPVIVLVDKYLMEGHATVNKNQITTISFEIERGKLLSDAEAESPVEYKRYEFTDDGVSPRSIPGQKGGIGLSGSDEHDERGLYNEEAEVRIKMMDKRFRKLEAATGEINPLALHGKADAQFLVIAFGSTKMPVLEAMRWLEKEGTNIGFLQIYSLSPFPGDLVASVIRSAQKTLIIELNHSGQLEGLVREHTGLSIDNRLRKYDGRPFYPEEIYQAIKNLL